MDNQERLMSHQENLMSHQESLMSDHKSLMVFWIGIYHTYIKGTLLCFIHICCHLSQAVHTACCSEALSETQASTLEAQPKVVPIRQATKTIRDDLALHSSNACANRGWPLSFMFAHKEDSG